MRETPFDKVREVISQATDIPADEITMSTTLTQLQMEGPLWESELVQILEDNFPSADLRRINRDVSHLATIGDIVEYITRIGTRS